MIRVPKKPRKGKSPAAGPWGLIFPLHLGAFLSPADTGQPGAPLGHGMSHPFSSPSEIIEGILAWVRSSLANGPWAWKWGQTRTLQHAWLSSPSSSPSGTVVEHLPDHCTLLSLLFGLFYFILTKMLCSVGAFLQLYRFHSLRELTELLKSNLTTLPWSKWKSKINGWWPHLTPDSQKTGIVLCLCSSLFFQHLGQIKAHCM